MKKTDLKKKPAIKEKKDTGDKESKVEKEVGAEKNDNDADDYITIDMPEVKDIPGQEKNSSAKNAGDDRHYGLIGR